LPPAHRRPPSANRPGFTIAEMLLSMTIMLAVLGLTTQLFRRQSEAIMTHGGRLDAQSNSRFALSMLDRELRVAGVGVVDQQPLLVMANTLGLTFNADLVALDTGDLGAVYINPNADSSAVSVFQQSNQIKLPGTTFLYPETTYTAAAGVPSNAETISYWLSHDSTSSHSNEYILFRRANAAPVRVVARGIIYNGASDTIFHYFEIAPSALPIIHPAAIHGSKADTAKSALADSIRMVTVKLTSVYHDPRAGTDVYRTMRRTIHLMNAGLIHHSTCGNPPLGVTPADTVIPADSTHPQTAVQITWSPSIDDGGGQKSVERYAIYRRLSSQTSFGQPFASVPAGASSYTFQDTDVQSGQTWTYGVAAQDCTPASSPIGTTSAVVIP
jgi:hypothetical protein